MARVPAYWVFFDSLDVDTNHDLCPGFCFYPTISPYDFSGHADRLFNPYLKNTSHLHSVDDRLQRNASDEF